MCLKLLVFVLIMLQENFDCYTIIRLQLRFSCGQKIGSLYSALWLDDDLTVDFCGEKILPSTV